ncbi:uncharacterized protein Tco025E_04983 [Trypanosoma conorhini]|uniref:Uncharacterized protein n=1 Tax=Trypanosoma conorhini TaxID=83891 RepID=A0A3R7N6P0_9TRYP|nr:uncharacterized protein Tco025E_04983 [Trypanosoma conorhini]RNF17100.1 hypothetical protein Tco025E_04983 [Trypanosoma conorhini]
MEADDILRGVVGGAEPLMPELQATHAQAPASQPRRTKLVFLYSSDDEEDVDPAEAKGEGGAVAVAAVVTLNPPPDSLREMRLEAELAAQRHPREPAQLIGEAEPPLFVEDTAGESAAPAPAAQGRVRVVEALPLRERDAGCGSTGPPLRRHLQAEEAERLAHARKRFRDEAGGGDGRVGDAGPQPMVDEDGLVRAIAVGGYQLTVDERQLQDCDCECECDCGDAEEAHAEAGLVASDCDDDDEAEEEEDEALEEALDEALVVAVVEQLVRCCESDELDASMREAGARFLVQARPCLQRLHAGELAPAPFGEEMRGEVLSLLRVFQRLRRPKDAPVVIDGVVMDM